VATVEGVTLYARTRFISALCLAIAGATLAVGAFVLSPSAERWLGVGVGAGSAVLLLGVFAARGRGTAQRVLDALALPICAWAVVSALTIETGALGLPDPHLVRWLGFSAGAAIAVIGVISLVAHEFSLEHDLVYATERIWGLTPRADAERTDSYSPSTTR
jgi:hypothetical protein